MVTSKDARRAIVALLAGQTVPLAKTPSVGCCAKWLYKEEGRRACGDREQARGA